MFRRPLHFALIAGLAIAGLTGEAQAKLKTVASFSILGDMVSRIGGDRIELATLVGPNADTHVYEPKPADAKLIAESSVLFVNGLGFEGWMTRLVEASGYKGPVIVVSDGVKPREMEEDGQQITDPHAWQDLSNGVLYASNIAAGLCKADPDGCDSYRKNAEAYQSELKALDKDVRDKIATVPADQRKVITSHDAFGYFGAAYGIEFIAPLGVSTDAEASAADVAKLIEQIRATGIKALFIENMTDPRLIEQIASETGVKPGGELYADALSAPGEGAETYIDMFRHNIRLLATAMAGS
ncbi:MAG: metal ABC transporter substrate-binding protein [Parvibaculaceae bacterium]